MAHHGNPEDDTVESTSPEDVLGEEEENETSGTDYSVGPGELSDDEGGAGPHEDIFESFTPAAQPIIPDPEDGLPRPADPAPAPGPLPLCEELMVCLADERKFVEVFAEELLHHDYPGFVQLCDPWAAEEKKKGLGATGPAPGRRVGNYSPYGGFQMSVNARSKYADDGEGQDREVFAPAEVKTLWGMKIGMGKNGARHRFVRPIRPQCAHFHGELAPVDNLVNGDGKIVEPMKMHCSGFKTVGGAMRSLFDATVSACTMRQPSDFVSEERFRARIRQKMEQGRNVTIHSIIKTVGTPTDWDAEANKHDYSWRFLSVPREALVDVPSTVSPVMIFTTPRAFACGNTEGFGREQPVRTIVLPDEKWQPEDHHYMGRDTGFHDAKPFGESLTGQQIYRVKLDEPSITSDRDAMLWPSSKEPMLRVQVMRQAESIAKQLQRGDEVSICCPHPERHGAFFGAVVLHYLLGISGLDALDRLKLVFGDGLVPNFAHRVFLRGLKERS